MNKNNYKEWKREDTDTLAPSPWRDEPDKVQWIDEETDLDCLIVRNRMGALCGYVGISEGHPFYGKDYSDCTLQIAKPRGKTEGDSSFLGNPRDESDRFVVRKRKQLICDGQGYCNHTPESILNVHGGITFSDFCHEVKNEDCANIICHIPAEGRPEKVWWFGFDCAHHDDCIPGYINHEYASILSNGVYRTIAYVKDEIRELSKQLRALAITRHET
jgi:hypothetical protein